MQPEPTHNHIRYGYNEDDMRWTLEFWNVGFGIFYIWMGPTLANSPYGAGTYTPYAGGVWNNVRWTACSGTATVTKYL